ncbi:MFS transporter [Nonomuraea sp. KC401]|uniref:MDR family MFS transporter n=1 Tax=unclassified Nonomuraea TaxID=2593643 RepID=UPI0010FF48EE|nr:MDR family MFS transporter [Nonomuraea sp. KC401]NBE92567.1 MFS transporter [Nonomuraea sp. K271]TLF79764.1 MFS transporter [Nonomuraea sp. KC401]
MWKPASEGASPAAQETPRSYSHGEVLKVLAGLVTGMITAMITTYIVGTALPTIVGELGGQDQYSWVASATLLTMAASMPLWGKVSDLYGRKRVYQSALVIFVAASMAAGFAPDIGWLIAARAVQGVGVGGLQSLSQIILGDLVEPRERGRYSGYMGSAFAISTLTGPLIGGFLVDAEGLGWRWCFFVSLPLAIVAFIIVSRLLKLPKLPTGNVPVDWWGAILITGGATTIMLLLTLGGKEFPWNSHWTYALGICSTLFFLLAIPVERAAAAPILPPRLFRNRNYVLICAVSILVGACLFGTTIYLPQYLQIVKGMTPTASGIMTLPMVGGTFVAALVSGQFVARLGRWKVFPATGMALVTIGLLLLSRLHGDSSRWAIGGSIAIVGAGLGLTMQILILAAQNAVERRDIASSTSSATFFRTFGGAVGVAAFGSILSTRVADEMREQMARFRLHLPTGNGIPALGSPEAIGRLPGLVQAIIREAFSNALHSVFLAAVLVAALGFLGTLFMHEVPLRTSPSAGETKKDHEPMEG